MPSSSNGFTVGKLYPESAEASVLDYPGSEAAGSLMCSDNGDGKEDDDEYYDDDEDYDDDDDRYGDDDEDYDYDDYDMEDF